MFVEKKNSGKYDHLLTCELRGQYEKTNGCNIAELVRQYKSNCRRQTLAEWATLGIFPFIMVLGMILFYFADRHIDSKLTVVLLVLTLVPAFTALSLLFVTLIDRTLKRTIDDPVATLENLEQSLPIFPFTASDRVNNEGGFKESLVYYAHRILRLEENFEDLCGQPKRVQPIVSTGSDILKCKADYKVLEEQAKKFGFFFVEGDIYKEARSR